MTQRVRCNCFELDTVSPDPLYDLFQIIIKRCAPYRDPVAFPVVLACKYQIFQTGSRTVTSGLADMSPPKKRTGSASGRYGRDALPVMINDAAKSALPGTVP